jgi:hypothetical protein
MGPCESVIEDVNWCIREVFGFNDLYQQSPSRIVTAFNGIIEIFDVIIRLLTSEP